MQSDEMVTLLDDRHQQLLDRLAADRNIMTNVAAAELGVSVDTIRRDLRHLHDRGLLRRVHGGAVRLSPLAPSFSGRTDDDSSERTKLADAVVQRFEPGQVIGLDGGTTTAAVAAQIPQSLEVTVVTNSPAVVMALADHRSASVTMLGGDIDLRWMVATGPTTVDAIRGVHFDLAIVGVCSFDIANGATTRSRQEVATKQAFMAAAAESIMPVESSKLATVAPFHVAGPTGAEILVVEGAVDPSSVEEWRQAGVQLTTVWSAAAPSGRPDGEQGRR